ncbi:MAG: type II secretion system F family protein [Formosimonas sp.]|jgi:type IV pilus assembly protein PilC
MTTPSPILRYTWHGQNRAGQAVTGVLYGEDKNSVREQLTQRGVVAQRIVVSREPLFRAVTQSQVTRFLSELATLYAAGVPLLRILSVLIHSQKNKHFKNVIQTIRLDIERGESLHRAFRHHPQVFDELTCNLVESGEAAGELDKVLFNITQTQERREQLNTQIKTALAYPLFVIVVALLVWVGLLIGVVPVFEGIYKNSGKSLPWLTQVLIDSSRFIRTQWAWLFVGAAVLLLFFRPARSVRWQYFKDAVKLKLPVFGDLMRTAWHAQFARTLALLYGAGVPLHEALSVSARTVPSLAMRDAIAAGTQDVLQGHSLSLSMSQHAIFESNLIQRIQIGEESGTLTTMLSQHAEHNEFLVEQTIKRLSSLIEPLLVLFIGVIVAVMVIALYWPILNLGAALR